MSQASKKKASSKEPFLPFFVGDFFAATMEWEGEARSLYATLLLHQWAGGTIPADPKKVCKMVKWDWEVFQIHWRCVRRKFEQVTGLNEYGEKEERLVNNRLEVHREKTQELSQKNSASGAKGAAKRWGKDGERHAEDMANATESDGERSIINSERHTPKMASATKSNGERHENEMANGWRNGEKRHPKIDGAADSNPSHPIPSHPDPESDRSSQDSAHVVLTGEHTRANEKGRDRITISEAHHHERFEQLMQRYPAYAGAPQPIAVEQCCRNLIDRGEETWDTLDAHADRFAKFVAAKGRSDARYVDHPLKFFRDPDLRRAAWDPPKTKAEQQQDENIDASEAWLREQELKDATG